MKLLRLLLLLGLIALAVFVPVAAADDDDDDGGPAVCTPIAVANGNFEAPPVVGPFIVHTAPSNIAGWTVEAGTVDHVGAYWTAAEGLQSLDLNGLSPGTISQILVTEPGETYRLRFAMSGNPDNGPNPKTMNVSFGGQLAASPAFDASANERDAMGWVNLEFEVTATGAASELEFRSTTGGFYGAAIDDVSVCQLDDDSDDDDDDEDDDDDDEDDDDDDDDGDDD